MSAWMVKIEDRNSHSEVVTHFKSSFSQRDGLELPTRSKPTFWLFILRSSLRLGSELFRGVIVGIICCGWI